jgi:hypothetical protein
MDKMEEEQAFLNRPSLNEAKKLEPPTDPKIYKVVAEVDNGGLEPDYILVEEDFESESEAQSWIHIEDTQMESDNVMQWFVLEVF